MQREQFQCRNTPAMIGQKGVPIGLMVGIICTGTLVMSRRTLELVESFLSRDGLACWGHSVRVVDWTVGWRCQMPLSR